MVTARRGIAGLIAAAGLMVLAGNAPSAPAPAAPHADGVPCVRCHPSPHGPEIATTCEGCHTEAAWSPSTFTREAHAAAGFALTGHHAEAACAGCHPSARLTGLPTECAGCHVDRHRGLLGADCTECHSTDGFKPTPPFAHAERTGFALVGSHEAAGCADCHQGARGQALRQGLGGACTTCHALGHGDFKAQDCATCHDPAQSVSFAAVIGAKVFDHRATGFALERRHRVVACKECHPIDGPKPLARCQSCHTDPHSGQLGARCDDCHQPDRWRVARFDHDLTMWPLRGRHFVVGCTTCHTSQRWLGLSTECFDCHALDAARAPKTVPAHRFGRVRCDDCHSQWTWR